jgi:quercetin dioxygenase-like cupin family protein
MQENSEMDKLFSAFHRIPLALSIVMLAAGCTSATQTPATSPTAATSPTTATAGLLHALADALPPSRPTTLPAQVFNWDEMKVQKTASGERRAVTQMPTATLDQLECHITTLNPGQQAHAPHRHPHEEIMLLKEGTLEAFVNGQHIPMPTGSILFVAPFDLHNVRNVGTTPATYFVMTWKTPRTQAPLTGAGATGSRVEPGTESPASQWKPDEGFTSLYNGKDLTGWGYPDEGKTFDGKTETDDNRYAAKGEVLTVIAHDQSQPPRIRKLFTTRQFPKDFTLKLEFRAAPNADSGIYLRTPQLQCRDYLVAGPYKTLKNYKPQEWNQIVVTVKDNIAHCECNGEVLEDALKLPETGPIGVESDRAQMEYRRIEVKEVE